MKFIINAFFILNVIILNAQTVQIKPNTESSVQVECNQIVKGEIKNKYTNDLLPNAEVILSDKDGNVLETQIVKEDATFSFKIKCETAYKLEGRKLDFTAESKDFTTSDEVGKVLKMLISLGKGNIDFITNTKAVKAEVETVEIKLEVLPDVQPNQVKVIKDFYAPNIDPIYFDYESSYLNKKAKNGLQKIVDLMNQYPRMIIVSASHTDSNGPDSYNNWMANRRVKRTVDYIIKKGIESSRITGKGYGETQLINHCEKNVECTDKEQAMNRRTEFVIIRI
jgi:outer membrane protein OmpA-like peptidoglycan-associated protein